MFDNFARPLEDVRRMKTAGCDMVANAFWRAIWCAVGLTVLMPLASSAASSEPGVLAIAPPDTNSSTAARKLVNISPGGSKEIAELSGHVIFGTDEDSAAFLELDGRGSAGGRLLVIDRKTHTVIADTNLPGVHSIPLKVLTADQAAVRTQGATVVVQIVDEHGFGFIEVNWKTGKVIRMPDDPKGYPVAWIPLPSGFVVSTFDETAAFDASTHDPIVRISGRGDHSDWRVRQALGRRQVYYVPTIGLMEYYNGLHLQLTDANLSTNMANPERFSSARIIGKIFVTDSPGKPLLIWGENTGPQDAHVPQNTINEIVFFDPGSKQEVLRKPLGNNFSENFRPNQAGTRVYFNKPDQGEIFCLDRTNQTISSFAKTGCQHFNDGWSGSEIVAGY